MFFLPLISLLVHCTFAISQKSTSTRSFTTTSSATQSSATTSSATSSAAATSGTPAVKGRGLTFPAANNPADVLNINQTHSLISWVYDWGLDAPAYLADSGIEYVPMQWGAGNIENLAASVKAQGSKVILGFNEPDFDEQSNLDPTYAAQLWQQYIDPLKDSGVRLGGPAVTSSGTGQPWLTQFLSACSNCTIDFLPLHWYGSGVAGFYDYLYQMHGQFPNYNFWITEFADTSLDATEVITFLNQSTTFLDGLDWVERYAWFGYFRPENGSSYNFLDADGGLNSLGTDYIGTGTKERSGPAIQQTTTAVGGGDPTKSLVTVSVATDGPPPTLTPNGAAAKWDALYQQGKNPLWSVGGVVSSCVLGMVWTLW